MSAGCSVAKLTAKTALKNNWLKVIVACLVLIFGFLITYILSSVIGFIFGGIIAAIFTVISSIFILIPLTFGVIKYCWRFIFGADDNPATVFSYFSSKEQYLRVLRLTKIIFFKAVIYGLILYLPAILVDIFSSAELYRLLNMPMPLWLTNLYYISLFLKVAASGVYFVLLLRYYFTPFLLSADENMTPKEAIHISTTLSKNSMFDLLELVLSFVGWFILGILVLPVIFTVPYFIVSICVHVRFVIADYNIKVSNTVNTEL